MNIYYIEENTHKDIEEIYKCVKDKSNLFEFVINKYQEIKNIDKKTLKFISREDLLKFHQDISKIPIEEILLYIDKNYSFDLDYYLWFYQWNKEKIISIIFKLLNINQSICPPKLKYFITGLASDLTNYKRSIEYQQITYYCFYGGYVWCLTIKNCLSFYGIIYSHLKFTGSLTVYSKF